VQADVPGSRIRVATPPAGVTVVPAYPLYSSGQIAAATFLGGTIAGGWLLALNYKRLGEPRRARAAIALGALAMAGVIAAAFVIPERAMSSLGLVPVIAMYWIAKSLQGAAYQRHLARLGQLGSSWRAAGVALASLAICGGAVFGAVIGYETWRAPDELAVGDGNVLYTDGITRAEARTVGEALLALDRFHTGTAWTVELARVDQRRVVAFVVKDFVFTDDQAQQGFHELADELSRRAFAGDPVDIWLADDDLDPHVKLTWDARPRKLELGDGHVVGYQQGATESEARDVARLLERRGYFMAGRPATVVVRRARLRHVVAFFFADRFQDPGLAAECRAYADALSRDAFGGQPVDIWINDRDGITQVKLDWESRPR
jgi:hypothetical protein